MSTNNTEASCVVPELLHCDDETMSERARTASLKTRWKVLGSSEFDKSCEHQSASQSRLCIHAEIDHLIRSSLSQVSSLSTVSCDRRYEMRRSHRFTGCSGVAPGCCRNAQLGTRMPFVAIAM